MKKTFLLLTFFLFITNVKAINNITINNNQIIPEFNKSVKTYNVFVNDETEIITINAEIEENEEVTNLGSKSLKWGLNTFVITSYINNEINTSYTLNVTRGSSVFDKETSVLENLEIDGLKLDFKSDVFNYIVKSNDINNIKVNYLTPNPKMSVKVSYNLNTSKENNLITIKVISENKKNTNTYKINIKKDVKDNKIVTKTSIFDNKKYDKFELKLIKIGISIFILSIILVFFYIIFLRKKNSNKVLYISQLLHQHIYNAMVHKYNQSYKLYLFYILIYSHIYKHFHLTI